MLEGINAGSKKDIVYIFIRKFEMNTIHILIFITLLSTDIFNLKKIHHDPSS